MVTSASATGYLALQNADASAIVTGTETIINNSAMQLLQIPFTGQAPNFDDTNEGQKYRVTMKCQTNCTGGQLHLYKAGLWVKLQDLSKAEVQYRLSLGHNGLSTDTPLVEQRTSIDSSLFLNPILRFFAVGKLNSLGGANIELQTASTNDFGSTGLQPIVPANLAVASETKSYLGPSAPLTLPANDRFLPLALPSLSPLDITTTILSIEFTE